MHWTSPGGVDGLRAERSLAHLAQWTIGLPRKPLTTNENNGHSAVAAQLVNHFAPNFRHEPPSDKGMENQIERHQTPGSHEHHRLSFGRLATKYPLGGGSISL